MCGDLLKTWLALVVCTCGVAAAGEPNEPVGEPNKPWITAEHLTAGWESIALTTRHFNKDSPEHRMDSVLRSMSLEGRIEVIDPNGLIGLAEIAMDASAFDESGKRIPTARISQSAPPYKPLRETITVWVPTGERIVGFAPFTCSIDMLESDAPFPPVLGKVEWSMAALVSDTFKVVDVPFAVSDDWIELAPGLDVLVEQAVAKNGRYEYRTKTRYDPNRVQYLHVGKDVSRPRSLAEIRDREDYSWPDGVLPEIIVTEIDVIDVEGNSIRRGSEGMVAIGTGGAFNPSDNRRIVTYDYSSRCPDCADAAFIRHVLAFKPYGRQVQFVLENVPVPTE